MKPECISEQLMFNTVRLSTGGGKACGTGFFFDFEVDGKTYQTIITNKHVVNYNPDEEVVFNIHLLDEDGGTTTSEVVTYTPHWFFHPQHDLCFCFVGPVTHAIKQVTGKDPFFISNDMSIFPTDKKLEDLRAVEEVTMVGYPISLWDEKNNLPIFRHGYTASHPALDFNEPGVGLVDMACFPGSSGSPIYILDEGSYQDKHGTNYVAASRVIFLGVLFGGPEYTAEGELRVKAVPTTATLKPVTNLMTNLGYYIRAKELLVFRDFIRAFVAAHP